MHAAALFTPDYAPQARVMAAALRRHHPHVDLTLLVLGEPLPDVPHARVLTLSAIGVSDMELRRRTLLYGDPVALQSALRPLLLRHVLDRGADAVLYLDVDQYALAPFDDVHALAATTGVLLSPHALAPLPGRPGAWPEEELLTSGTFNGGFYGVGRAGIPFLDWLAERTALDCAAAPDRGLFYGQTWLNLVPALFEHRILRDPGINTQTHALRGRDLTWDGGRPATDGVPVRLYHFTGFDPGQPDRLSRYDADGADLHDRPGLRRLCHAYAHELHDAGWQPVAKAPPLLDDVERDAYRHAVAAGESPPVNLAAVHGWLREPEPLSRYLRALHRLRGDLQAAFPAVPGADDGAFVAWAAGTPEIPERFRPR